MNAAIEKPGAGGKLSELDTVAVLRRQVKQHQDSIEGFEKGGRSELAEKERKEIEVLHEYLPQPLSNAEVAEIIEAAIKETGGISRTPVAQVMK
jgi:uncharacterized protein YqeY